jgi:hypothetical protein
VLRAMCVMCVCCLCVLCAHVCDVCVLCVCVCVYCACMVHVFVCVCACIWFLHHPPLLPQRWPACVCVRACERAHAREARINICKKVTY